MLFAIQILLLHHAFSSEVEGGEPLSISRESSAKTTDTKETFIKRAIAVREKLTGPVMLTEDGLSMVDHVATTLTDMDPQLVAKFCEWGANFVRENKCVAATFFTLVGGLTVVLGNKVKSFAHVIELAADWRLPQRLALYQTLMFIRVFVSGLVPGASPAFTAPIQIIENASMRRYNTVDHTMAITMVASVLPNLLARIPGFSEFCWRYGSEVPPLGKTVSIIMRDAFNAGHNDKEKAGNAIALGHFTPGSGTFTSLVAGMFVLSIFDLLVSGFLGIADDLFLNVGLKSMTSPAEALEDAQFMIIFAQLFKIIFSGAVQKMPGQFAMHAFNFVLIQSALLAYQVFLERKSERYELCMQQLGENCLKAVVPVWVPFGTLVTAAMILPGVERFVLRCAGCEPGRTHHGGHENSQNVGPLPTDLSSEGSE